jgi:hypothetical protein
MMPSPTLRPDDADGSGQPDYRYRWAHFGEGDQILEAKVILKVFSL